MSELIDVQVTPIWSLHTAYKYWNATLSPIDKHKYHVLIKHEKNKKWKKAERKKEATVDYYIL